MNQGESLEERYQKWRSKRYASLRQYLNECADAKRQYAGDVEKINSAQIAAYKAHRERMGE